MSHSLFGDRFLGRRPAWHDMGTVIDPTESLTFAQAIPLAGLDYEVKLTKVVTEAFGTRIDTGRVAIVRQPTHDDPKPRVFGFATPKYRPLQNAQLGQLLQPIVDRTGWRVETLGALGRGERVFMTLQAGRVEIPGDSSPVTIFYFVADGKDGTHGLTVGCTPVRIVCENTLVMGLGAATITAQVQHKGDVESEAAFTFDIVSKMQESAESVTAAMRLLAAKPAPVDRLAEVFDAAYPDRGLNPAALQAKAFLESTVTLTDARRKQLEGKISDRQNWLDSVKEYKAAALERFVAFNGEFPAVASTPWAAYNAVVETEQYRRGKSNTTIARDVMFNGLRGQTMVAAFDAAYAIAKSL